MIFFEQKVILPLEGGQLSALNIDTGTLEWFFDIPHKSIFDIEDNGIIYGMDNVNSILFAIDANTGTNQAKKDISGEIKEKKLSYLDGHLLVFEDKLIVRFAENGCIAIFNKNTLDLIEVKQACGAFLGLRKDNVIWYKDKLFVLDPVSHVLYADI